MSWFKTSRYLRLISIPSCDWFDNCRLQMAPKGRVCCAAGLFNIKLSHSNTRLYIFHSIFQTSSHRKETISFINWAFQWLISAAFLMKLPSNECHRIQGPIYGESILFHLMAWCQATSFYKRQCWPRLLLPSLSHIKLWTKFPTPRDPFN